MSFSCPLRLLLRGSGFLFGAVLAVPSVPQGCLRTCLGVPLRTARGTQKGPPYRRDLLFLGSLWGPLGCSVGSRTLFFWPILLISSRGAYEVAPQELAWVGCSRFWARSGCGGLAWGRAWGALGASPGALGGLWALWGPLGGGVWEFLGSLGASGGLWVARRVPQARPQRRLWGVSGGLWGPLGASGGTTATRGH